VFELVLIKTMKAVICVACFVGGVVLCYLLVSLGVVDAVDGIPSTLQEPAIAIPTYLGFISAMMTAVTAVLAALAIGIGLVAFFTFQGIKEEALKKVDEAIKEKLSKKVVMAQINRVALDKTRGELDKDFDQDDDKGEP